MLEQNKEENKTKHIRKKDGISTQRTISFCTFWDVCLYLKERWGRAEDWVTYSAHVKALSSACREPPTNGFGGFGSLAIHHPTGIRTAFKPLLAMNLKSSSTIYVFQWFCHHVKIDN